MMLFGERRIKALLPAAWRCPHRPFFQEERILPVPRCAARIKALGENAVWPYMVSHSIPPGSMFSAHAVNIGRKRVCGSVIVVSSSGGRCRYGGA